MTLEEVLDATRTLLGGVLVFTSFVTWRTSLLFNEVFRPNGWFVSLWCAVCGAGMLAVGIGGPSNEVFEVVNISALLLFAGWSVLLLRIGRRLDAASRRG